MSNEIVHKNGRLIISGYDVTDCPTIKYPDSYNPCCGDSSVTCLGNPNCLYKKCIDKDRELRETKHKYRELENELDNMTIKHRYYKEMCLDLLIDQVAYLKEELKRKKK